MICGKTQPKLVIYSYNIMALRTSRERTGITGVIYSGHDFIYFYAVRNFNQRREPASRRVRMQLGVTSVHCIKPSLGWICCVFAWD